MIETGFYRHFKGGEYVVYGEAVLESDPSVKYVVYKPRVTNAADVNKFYLRTEADFTEHVEVTTARFTKVEGP